MAEHTVVLDRYEDVGNDNLNMYGTVDGTEVLTHAWVSALSWYPPESYDENGNRYPDAVRRPRTESEIYDMFLSRTMEQHPDLFV